MDTMQQILPYVFPALLAFAIIYFFIGIAYVKYIKDYAKINEGKEKIFNALALMVCILVVWALVHSVVAAIS